MISECSRPCFSARCRITLVLLATVALLPFLIHASDTRIINGEDVDTLPEDLWPSVGIVGDDGGGFCSGTLIEPDKVLTAAHCTDDLNPQDAVFTLDGVPYTVKQIYVHPGFQPSTLANDVSVMILDMAVEGITPSPIYRQTPMVGEELTLVGFGYGGTGDTGYDPPNFPFGVKRVGTTPIDDVQSTLILWNFENNSESNTAPGDSGGPAFLYKNDVYVVAGITSGGFKANASIGDLSFDTRVDAFADWIDDPASAPKLLIYELKEKLELIGNYGREKIKREGYLIVDYNGYEANAVTTWKHDKMLHFNTESWGFDSMALGVAEGEKRDYAIFATQDIGAEASASSAYTTTSAWRQCLGKADVSFAGTITSKRFKGSSLVYDTEAGVLSSGALRLKLDTEISAQASLYSLEEATTAIYNSLSGGASASNLDAAYPNGEYDDVETAELPPLRIYKIKGKNPVIGLGQEAKLKAEGYLVLLDGESPTIIIRFDTSPVSIQDLEFENDFLNSWNAVLNGKRKEYHFVAASDDLYAPCEVIAFVGSTRTGKMVKRFEGIWSQIGTMIYDHVEMKARYDKKASALYMGEELSNIILSLRQELSDD